MGEGSLGSRGLMSGSVRKAAEKVESISAGRRGGGPPKKPMAFCASRESSASLRGSPPVPALVCSLSPVRIWRQERGRLAARAVKPAWPPCWPSSMIEFFFFLVSRTRHHSCAGHCSTIRSHCNFIRNATIPQAETHNKRTQNQQQPNKKPTTQHQPHPNRKPST